MSQTRGRPTLAEHTRRERAFVRELARLGKFAEAAEAVGMDARHVVRLLDAEPQVRAVAGAVLQEAA